MLAALLCVGAVTFTVTFGGTSSLGVSGAAAAASCPPATSSTGDSDGVFFLPIGDDSSKRTEDLTIPITFTAPTCEATVRLTAARGVTRSFAFPAPGQKTTRTFRVDSANTCDLRKIQQISPSATAHRCAVQVLTVRVMQVGGDLTAKSTRDSCLYVTLLARKSGPTGRANRERTHVGVTAERTDSLAVGGTLTLSFTYPKGASSDGAVGAGGASTPAVVKQCNK